jgi:hypothetical protein
MLPRSRSEAACHLAGHVRDTNFRVVSADPDGIGIGIGW